MIIGKRILLSNIHPRDYGFFQGLIDAISQKTGEALVVGNPIPITETSRGWLIKTKEGSASRQAGVICFTPITNTTITLQCILTKQFSNKLEVFIEKKYTYVEDAIRTAITELLNNFYRIEVPVLDIDDNEIWVQVLEKCGFINEATLVNYCKDDTGTVRNIVIMAVVKEDKKDENTNNKEAQGVEQVSEPAKLST